MLVEHGRKPVGSAAWALTKHQHILDGRTQQNSSGELQIAALLATKVLSLRAWELNPLEGRVFVRGWTGVGGDARPTPRHIPAELGVLLHITLSGLLARMAHVSSAIHPCFH